MNLHRGGLQQLNFSKDIFLKPNKSYATKYLNVNLLLDNGIKIDYLSYYEMGNFNTRKNIFRA